MLEINIARAELESGTMSPEHLSAAVQAMKTDGFVVLTDIVDPAHLAILRDRMLADVEKILSRDDTPFNFNTGNIQQMPPPFPPYLFRDVLANPMVIAVVRAVIGRGIKFTDYTGNTCLPGELKQPVHADVGHLWSNMEHPTPTFGIVANVPVVDMTPQNGSTEIWPGTHLDTTIGKGDDIKIPEEKLRQREQVAPPFQPSVRCGSVLIRDMRLWHRGMPNYTGTPRPMIALIYWADWWQAGEPMRFPRGSERFLQHPDLRVHAEFVDDDEISDHTRHGEAYDFHP